MISLLLNRRNKELEIILDKPAPESSGSELKKEVLRSDRHEAIRNVLTKYDTIVLNLARGEESIESYTITYLGKAVCISQAVCSDSNVNGPVSKQDVKKESLCGLCSVYDNCPRSHEFDDFYIPVK